MAREGVEGGGGITEEWVEEGEGRIAGGRMEERRDGMVGRRGGGERRWNVMVEGEEGRGMERQVRRGRRWSGRGSGGMWRNGKTEGRGRGRSGIKGGMGGRERR